ncbi:MAG: hypothetical protein HRU28_14355 [Rhizobiales bacterium]|nr:hypothetical protein [Hyphomicrobiales bacterium]
MTVLSFKKEFAPAVENKTKVQTIRKARKRPIKPGEKLQLYTGMRTKQCRKLHNAICTSVASITIKVKFFKTGDCICLIHINGNFLDEEETEQFAKDNGFNDVVSFAEFFETEDNSIFEGQLIKWSFK